jgi:hypothetical protein
LAISGQDLWQTNLSLLYMRTGSIEGQISSMYWSIYWYCN